MSSTATIELPPRRAWVVRQSPTGLYLTDQGTYAFVLCDARLLFSFVEAEDCLWANGNVYLEEVSVATTHRISKP